MVKRKLGLSKTKRRIISLCISLLLLGMGYYSSLHPEQTTQLVAGVRTGSYKVVDFADGDTISVDMNGTTERIRLIGVDTPETHDPRKVVQCFGQAASKYTKELIGNNSVRLEADPLSTNRDRYNRLLRYVYLPDGRLVQAEIIKNGYGFAYVSFPFTKSEEFLSYQTQARDGNKGLWANCDPTQNKYGGYTSNPN